MSVFPFRPPRIETSLPSYVQLQETSSGQPLSPKADATIVNVSTGGACLVVSQLILDKKHLFYDTLDSDTCNLLLRTGKTDCTSETFTISARSVWMDSCDFNGKPAFKIGVSFLQKQKELFTEIKKGVAS